MRITPGWDGAGLWFLLTYLKEVMDFARCIQSHPARHFWLFPGLRRITGGAIGPHDARDVFRASSGLRAFPIKKSRFQKAGCSLRPCQSRAARTRTMSLPSDIRLSMARSRDPGPPPLTARFHVGISTAQDVRTACLAAVA